MLKRQRRSLHPAPVNLPLRRIGRYVVWFVIFLVIARGVVAIVRPSTASRVYERSSTAAFTPSPQMLWAATAFARDYLSVGTTNGDGSAQRFFATGANASVASPGNYSSYVTSAEPVTWAQDGNANHALITVNAVVAVRGHQVERYLAVPVAQTQAGIAVFAEPSLTAPPAVDPTAPGPPGELASAPPAPAGVSTLLTQFFSAYFAGQDLTYYEAPTANLPEPSAGLKFESVTNTQELYTNPDGSMEVLASVQVGDTTTGATYPLQYQLAVKQLDRWIVTSIDGQ